MSLTNLGRSGVFVDLGRIGSILALAPLDKGRADPLEDAYSVIEHGVPTHSKRRIVALNPKESIRKLVTFVFEAEALSFAGIYKVKIGYSGDMNDQLVGIESNRGRIYSNTQLFELKTCK